MHYSISECIMYSKARVSIEYHVTRENMIPTLVISVGSCYLQFKEG